jgi:hypothetical protein
MRGWRFRGGTTLALRTTVLIFKRAIYSLCEWSEEVFLRKRSRREKGFDLPSSARTSPRPTWLVALLSTFVLFVGCRFAFGAAGQDRPISNPVSRNSAAIREGASLFRASCPLAPNSRYAVRRTLPATDANARRTDTDALTITEHRTIYYVAPG